MRSAVDLLFGCAVDGAVVVAGVADDFSRREHIRVDHMPAVIGNEAHRGFADAVVPAEFFEPVGGLVEGPPVVEVGKSRDADRVVVEWPIISKVVGRTDDAAPY